MNPMKPESVTPEQVRLPTWGEPKFDGIRGRIIAAKLLSNSNKAIPNPHISGLLSRPELTGFDGEIIVGPVTAKNVRHVSAGTCNRTKWTPVIPAFKFYVFDDFSAKGGYAARYAVLAQRVAKLPAELRERIVLVEATELKTVQAVQAFLDKMLADGFEGAIFRTPDGAFKEGRSTVSEQGLLRIKPRESAEAHILGVVEEMHNANAAFTNELGRTTRSSSKAGKVGKGRAGAFRAKDLKTGVEFTMGGFNDKQKAEFWKLREQIEECARIGKPLLATYSRQAFGSQKDGPVSPIFESFRAAWDMEQAA